VMPGGRDELVEDGGVDRGGVGDHLACGVPLRRHTVRPGLLHGAFVLVDQATEDRSAFDPLACQVDYRAVGSWWVQAQCPVGSATRCRGARIRRGHGAGATRSRSCPTSNQNSTSAQVSPSNGVLEPHRLRDRQPGGNRSSRSSNPTGRHRTTGCPGRRPVPFSRRSSSARVGVQDRLPPTSALNPVRRYRAVGCEPLRVQK
jgi:hypothetical protein